MQRFITIPVCRLHFFIVKIEAQCDAFSFRFYCDNKNENVLSNVYVELLMHRSAAQILSTQKVNL